MTFIREYGLLIATVLGLGLVVTAWNLESPPLWLTLPGWTILSIRIAIFVVSLPKNSPYFVGFVLSVLAFFLLFASTTTSRAMFNFILQPSFDHLFNFVFGRGFLLTTIVYFASACLAYGTELRKAEDERDRFREGAEELERLKMLRLEQILEDSRSGGEQEAEGTNMPITGRRRTHQNPTVQTTATENGHGYFASGEILHLTCKSMEEAMRELDALMFEKFPSHNCDLHRCEDWRELPSDGQDT